MKTYDFVVIGGGSAGYAAARTAVDLGLDTAVVDGADELGGLCILRGCMPSKALIESANRALAIRRAGEFGLRATLDSVDAPAVYRRKAEMIEEFASYRRGQLADGPFELIRGWARYRDASTLEVSPHGGRSPFRIGAKTSVIAAGSEVARPPVPGLDGPGVWTSDDVLALGTVPSSAVVLGGGAIALEMAHFLDGMGADVTVIQRSEHLLTGLDHDVADCLQASLEERGIKVFTGTKLRSVTGPGGSHRVAFEHRGEGREAEAEALLAALGRRPATSGLDLAAAGVEATGNGRVIADAEQRTSQPTIFAAGDACGPHEVVHTAISQGETAATNAAVALGRLPAGRRRALDDRLKLLGIFTQPQVASVGLTEAEASAAGRPVTTATYPFDDHGKSMVRGEIDGFVKLIADRDSGELVGGAAVGPEAVELIHEIVVAMHFRSTAADLAAVPHYHPTLSEIWTYPAEEIAGV